MDKETFTANSADDSHLTDQPVYTVSQLNNDLSFLIENFEPFQSISIIGELRNLKYYEKGNQLYFSLIDNASQLSCVIYSDGLKRLPFSPENGHSVIIKGRLKHFRKRGQYCLHVHYMAPKGDGSLSKAFDLLKNKLLKEGLFDTSKKKRLPPYPNKVGVITSSSSAALADFLKIKQTLVPHLPITLYPATMQGETASNSIRTALTIALEHNRPDIIVILRGGGSSEDLACFNDEQLVRHIAGYPIPTITAIGHETDFSLSDAAADLSAPTPSAASQAIATNFTHFKTTFPNRLKHLHSQLRTRISSQQETLTHQLKCIIHTIYAKREKRTLLVATIQQRLALGNPLHKLTQGYSICRLKKEGAILKSTGDITLGDVIITQLKDGTFESSVNSLMKN